MNHPQPPDAVPWEREPTAAEGRPGWVVAVLLVMAAVAVSQGFTRFTYAFVLPDMTADVLGSYGVAGALGAANLGGYLAGVSAVTALGHRVESTLLLKRGLAMTVLGLLVIATAPHPALLFVGMAVAGMCSAAVWIPCASIIAAYAPESRRGLAFGIVTAGIGMAIALTGQLTSWVHALFGESSWRPVWGVVVALSTVILALELAFLRPVEQRPDQAPRRVVVRRVLPGAVPLLLCYGAYGASFALYAQFLVAALQEGFGYDSGRAADAYSLLGLASVFGGVVLGRASDRLGRRPVLSGALVLVGGCAVVIALRIDALVLMSVVVYGLLMTGFGTVVVAYLSDQLEPPDMAAAFGSITLAISLAQLVTPPLGGWAADVTGSFQVTFLLAAATAGLAALLAVCLPRAGAPRRATSVVDHPSGRDAGRP